MNDYKKSHPWSTAWTSLNYRAGNRSRQHPTYASVEVRMAKDEFYAWYQEELTTFNEKFPGETPSVDRIDPNGHYEMGNIRLIPWRENSRLRPRNYNAYAPEGTHWCQRCRGYLPLDAFSRCKGRPHGRFHLCKTHHAEYHAERKLLKTK